MGALEIDILRSRPTGHGTIGCPLEGAGGFPVREVSGELNCRNQLAFRFQLNQVDGRQPVAGRTVGKIVLCAGVSPIGDDLNINGVASADPVRAVSCYSEKEIVRVGGCRQLRLSATPGFGVC